MESPWLRLMQNLFYPAFLGAVLVSFGTSLITDIGAGGATKIFERGYSYAWGLWLIAYFVAVFLILETSRELIKLNQSPYGPMPFLSDFGDLIVITLSFYFLGLIIGSPENWNPQNLYRILYGIPVFALLSGFLKGRKKSWFKTRIISIAGAFVFPTIGLVTISVEAVPEAHALILISMTVFLMFYFNVILAELKCTQKHIQKHQKKDTQGGG